MLLKNTYVNRWLWKWHIISGLVCVPILLLLSITGILYLFKEDYNNHEYKTARFVDVPSGISEGFYKHYQPFVVQLNAARHFSEKEVSEVKLAESADQAIAFRIQGKGRSRHFVYVNPYTAEVTGEYVQKESLMFTIRKLHGELLLGKVGTLAVELVASWMIVLILTGLYIWWPLKKFQLSSYFSVRFNEGTSVFFRDLHAVLGFWVSIFLLIILAGGMPWTDVFGSNLKWVQSKTGTGFPQDWQRTSLKSESFQNQQRSLDDIIAMSEINTLQGQIVIQLPRSESSVYTVRNRSFLLRDQQVLHIDQYSGQILKELNWQDVGVLMDMRQVAMRLHQGEYGRINWYVVLAVVLIFTLTTIAGFTRYFIRKPKGRWGLPNVPESFTPGLGLLVPIVGCAFLFPLFGLSLLVLTFCSFFSKAGKSRIGIAAD